MRVIANATRLMRCVASLFAMVALTADCSAIVGVTCWMGAPSDTRERLSEKPVGSTFPKPHNYRHSSKRQWLLNNYTKTEGRRRSYQRNSYVSPDIGPFEVLGRTT
jgi:hypothetical protein